MFAILTTLIVFVFIGIVFTVQACLGLSKTEITFGVKDCQDEDEGFLHGFIAPATVAGLSMAALMARRD